jgi:predicted transposase YdaD
MTTICEKEGRKEGRKEGKKEGRKEGRKVAASSHLVSASAWLQCLSVSTKISAQTDCLARNLNSAFPKKGLRKLKNGVNTATA